MPDLNHLWGNDLTVSPSGDLATVGDAMLTQQRVLRRLLTNPGDDIWSLGYGAGLSRFVGLPGASNAIRAAIRGQIFKEASVARTPEPVIDVATDAAGSIYVQIRYADALGGAAQTLSLTIP
jgi:hypothetical protein